MKLTIFSISRTKQIYVTTLTVSETTFKIKAISPRKLFEILLTYTVICKQKLLHGNNIVQYLQNYKYQEVNQSHFRNPLQSSTNVMINSYTIVVDSSFIFHGPFNF